MIKPEPLTPAVSGRSGRGTTLIIGLDEQHETIADLLGAEGLDVIAVERLEDLDDAWPDFAAAIVCVKDSAPSFPPALRSLARRLDGTPLVIVCPSIDRRGVRTALIAGVSGVVTLDELDEVLGPCVRAVAARQICVPHEHGRQIEPPALSSREKQILGLVVMGYMNGQIAEQLFLAESTVKSHLSSAFGKLGVRSRNEAVNLILDPDRGLGMGILALGGEPIELASTATP
jgi:DNA-binding NarL/FixJ family response regulator